MRLMLLTENGKTSLQDLYLKPSSFNLQEPNYFKWGVFSVYHY
jgi:hypothetical protein